MATASSIPCVTTKMAFVGNSFACHNLNNSERKFSAVKTSSALNGSSMHSSSARTASARANPIRCLIPPDNSLGNAFSYPSNPIVSIALRALFLRSTTGTFCASIPSSTFSSTVNHGNSAKF
mmetsp:Transcript_14473/g.24954  ORF Transcript_14473/g.24954 Transcript_14473/m.24954 type:complete len:122 (+) Transcript_14473:298-663(+)